MKPLAAILCLCLCLASCGGRVPRAIIPAPSVIAALNVEPVAKAGIATRDAVRGVAAAGGNTRATASQLLAAIDRAEKIAVAHAELAEAFAEIQTLADQLQTDLVFAAEREKIAILAVDGMSAIIYTLQSDSAAQNVQISYARLAEETLREQVQSLSASADKRIIAEDKLEWWRWASIITWAVLLIYLLARFFGTAILTALKIR